ncbi:MAG TPA: MarR family transcriptional regulator [Polyangiaceae bacterium]|nr:MarR family transcriptional regulator [Polyangiaceae bacterium]
MNSAAKTAASSDAELQVADMVGRLMQFWGFKRPMGRLWTLLYLAPEPLTAADIAQSLHMSAGAVSMTLNELAKWGAVKKTWRPGERRDFYEAETSVWKLVRRVIGDRELTLVREFSDALGAADRALAAADLEPSVRSFKKERVERLLELSKLGENLLSALVAGQAVDPAQIEQASK